ncbi:unnamed protein product [Calypogeia fissa]
MSCKCCQPGGYSSEEDYEEQEEEEVNIPSISALRAMVESLVTTQIPAAAYTQASADEQQPIADEGMQKVLHDDGVCKDRVQSLVEAGITEIPAAYIRPIDERPKASGIVVEIPVIDLGGAEGGDKEAIRAEIGRACEDWGFFQVVNHGVPLSVLEGMRKDGRAFFGLPMEEKLRYACNPGTIASEGYGNKMLVKDEQVLDWRDYLDLHTLPLSRRVPSNWPALPDSFRQTVVQYSEEMRALAQRLLALVSESLGLPSSSMKDALGEPSQNVSVNYYPTCPQPDLTLGLQAHSDLGAITILMQADIAGLQVFKDGNWIAVQPLTDALVVNLGDMMEVLSNGKYKSVEHRAVVNAQRDRLSVATFLDPAKDQLITPASALIDSKHPVLYKDVVFRDFVASWYSKGPSGKRNIDNLLF